jgi:Rod binding domain-containing protein
MSLSVSALPLDLMKPAVATPTAAAGASPAKTSASIAHTAQSFEASFLTSALGQMFEGTGEGAFSGGEGEQMFRSVLMDAFAKQITKSGGIGVAASVQREMLKMQGLK